MGGEGKEPMAAFFSFHRNNLIQSKNTQIAIMYTSKLSTDTAFLN